LYYFASASWDSYGGEWRNNLAQGQAAGDSIFIPFPPPGRTINFVTGPTRADNSKLGGEQNTDATLKFIFKPSENHEFEIKGNYAGGSDDHFPALLVDFSELNCFRPGIDANAGPESAGYFCGKLSADDRTSSLNIPDLVDGGTTSFFGVTAEASPIGAGTDRDVFRLFGQYTGTFNDWETVARVTWNRDRFKSGRDLDRTSFRPVFGLFTAYEEDNTEDWAGELRFSSPQENALRGLFGAYYFEKRFEETDRRFSGPGTAGTFVASGFGVCTTSPATFDPIGCDSTGEDVTNYAVFGHLDYDISSQLTFSAEARYSKDEKTVHGGVLTDAEAALTTTLVSTLDIASVEGNRLIVQDSTKKFTPRFTLTYKPNEDVTLYGLVAKGDKPLDFNLSFFDDDTDPTEVVGAVADGRAVIRSETA
jgi:iron complex outermembrane recepter protein